jgi:hypothetical protein
MTFALVQLDRESQDPMVLARALAAIRKTPVQDQVLAAKSAWGVIADDLSENEAKELQRGLWSQGVKSVVGPAAALSRLAPFEAVETLDALPTPPPILIAVAGTTLTTTITATRDTGPSGVQQVASAAIMMTTGLPIKLGPRKRPGKETQEEQSLAFHADLHYGGPSRRIRVDASHFDFSCLGARMLYHAQGNLRLLIGDVARAAPEAWLNHGARVLLEGRPIRTMGYRSLEDLEREARWLLTLRRLAP